VAQARKEAQDQISRGNGPGDEGQGLVEIVDGAALQAQAAHHHGAGVEEHPGQQQEIIDMVVAAKALAPEEDGVQGAAAVNDHGDQEAVSRIPRHDVSLTDVAEGLKSKIPSVLYCLVAMSVVHLRHE
jgi:hypothetical protein